MVRIIPDKVTNTSVKMRYLPNNGITNDVAGMISIKTKKKNVNESRIETDNVTYILKNSLVLSW